MQPLLFDVPPLYGTIFKLAAGAWCALEILGALLQRSAAKSTRRDRGSFLVVMAGTWIGVGGALWAAAWLPGLAIATPRYALYWAGILLMLAGLGLRWYAISVLGRWFTRAVQTHADQTLVDTGPYRVVRHPAYAGSLLSLLGMGLVLANWGSLAILVLGGLGGLVYRIRVEEEALQAALGQPYRDYMRRTRRLIPFVW
jgi:protein-S-isoprenylcysteine O-methyltransferase Ste14